MISTVTLYQTDNNTVLLSNLSDVYGLHQLINILTRLTSASSTLIDVAFTKCLDRVVCLVVSHVSLCHDSLAYVFCKVSIDPSSFKGHSTVTYRKFKIFNSARFGFNISQQNWDSVNNYEDSNDMWKAWKSLFFQCVDKDAPLRSKHGICVSRVGGKQPAIFKGC